MGKRDYPRPSKKKRKAFKPRADHPRCPVTGKLRYSSLSAAENVLKDIILRGSSRQRAYRCYQCQDCGGWHHTSQPPRDRS